MMAPRRLLGRFNIVAALAVLANANAADEPELPVLHTTSRSIDVRDGDRVLPGYWGVSSDIPLDVYYARPAAGDRSIAFHSDTDTLSVTLRPGEHHDFEMVLDGKRCCRTRISTLRQLPRGIGADDVRTIPFTLGPDDKIHVTGRINDSQPLDLEVDLGADTAVLFPSALAKGAAPRVDGRADNAGTGGIVRREYSNDNRLGVGELLWEHTSFVINEIQADRADGIIGFTQFDNLVVEIDFDAGVLRVAHELPVRAASATKLGVKFRHQLPEVEVTIDDGIAPFVASLVLDTGSNLSAFLSNAGAGKSDLASLLPRLGHSEMRGTGPAAVSNDVLLLPALHLGDQSLRDVPLHLARAPAGAYAEGHLGMDVLRRFNLVLDLRKDVAYFTPNGYRDSPYRANYRTGLAWKLVAGVGAVAAIMAAVALRRRRRRG